jgi:hypothetical protein
MRDFVRRRPRMSSILVSHTENAGQGHFVASENVISCANSSDYQKNASELFEGGF